VVHGSEVTLFLTWIVALSLTRHATSPNTYVARSRGAFPPRKRGALRPFTTNSRVPVVSDETNTQSRHRLAPASATPVRHHKLATHDQDLAVIERSGARAPRPSQGQGQGGGNRRRRGGRGRGGQGGAQGGVKAVSPETPFGPSTHRSRRPRRKRPVTECAGRGKNKRRRGGERRTRAQGRYLMCVHTSKEATHIATLEAAPWSSTPSPKRPTRRTRSTQHLRRKNPERPAGHGTAFVDIGIPKNAVLYRGDISLTWMTLKARRRTTSALNR